MIGLLAVDWERPILARRAGTLPVSSDGLSVTFTSGATDLVDGDTNGQTDFFARTQPDVPPQRELHGGGGRPGQRWFTID